MQGPSSNSSELDIEGQHYLDVQRHAGAVQLFARSLAIAHLRAQTVMPRGSSVKTRSTAKPYIKPEPDAMTDQQQRQPLPQQPPAAQAAASQVCVQPVIKISVSCSAAELNLKEPQAAPQQQQQQQHPAAKHVALKPRLLVHRQPDASAAQRFRADELPDAEGEGAGSAAAAAAEQHAALAPRMVADPGQLGHALAGWVRVAGEGGEAEVGEDVGMDDEDMLGPGTAQVEEDMMDEEEWV